MPGAISVAVDAVQPATAPQQLEDHVRKVFPRQGGGALILIGRRSQATSTAPLPATSFPVIYLGEPRSADDLLEAAPSS